GGLECMGVVDLVALSKARTRMLVSLDLKPTTLSSRLMVQSLRLAKGSLNRRFKARVAQFASGIA
ncbi:MAG: SRPBCC family protein, partial [Pseudomonadota bacterium]